MTDRRLLFFLLWTALLPLSCGTDPASNGAGGDPGEEVETDGSRDEGDLSEDLDTTDDFTEANDEGADEPLDPDGEGEDAEDLAEDSATDPEAEELPEPLPFWHVCQYAARPEGRPTVVWNHWTSEVVAMGEPDHSAQDVIAVVGRSTELVGKFAYGWFSSDLEDERIEVFLDRCGVDLEWVGEAATDSDGRVVVPIEADDLPGAGSYAVHLRVMGDDTWTRSTLWVYPPGTQLVVFDIDATLTTDDLEVFTDVLADLFEPIGTGDYVPQARDGALEITTIRGVEQHYGLLYLTGRPYNLTEVSREWLAEEGFPAGTLHVCDSVGDVMPTEGAVGTYKTEYLQRLLALDLVIPLAYGNASTDIYAYGNAGIPRERTFILGDHGGEEGTIALGEDYLDHLEAARAEEAPEQPFRVVE